MSGVVPQVAALMGPCAAGTAYIPGLADFVPMVKGRGSMALAGPHLTKAVTGEDVTQEELGGSKIHTRVSGVGDLEVGSDEDCIEAVRSLPLVLPLQLRGAAAGPPERRPGRPVEEELLDILPDSPRHPYDMYEVIRRIVDDGELFDIKPRFARTIITCLARMGGLPWGSWPTSRAPGRHPRERLGRQGRALHQPLRRLRHPLAVPHGRAGLHGGHQGRAGRDHPPRRQDALRRIARHRAEGHGRWCARPTAPATT